MDERPFLRHCEDVAHATAALAVRARGRAEQRGRADRELSAQARAELAAIADDLEQTAAALRRLARPDAGFQAFAGRVARALTNGDPIP